MLTAVIILMQVYRLAVTKRTNTPTLHTANNAIRLCRVHTNHTLKSLFEDTGRGPPHVGLETLQRREGGTRVGGCA